MARKSFWQRVKEQVRRIIGVPVPKPAPPPPPPPPRPSAPPPSFRNPNYELDQTRIDIYEDITSTTREVDEWWDLFLDTGVAGHEDYDHTNDAWNGFLRAWWLNTSEEGHMTRADWLDDWDVSRRLIDWDHWREIKKTP